VTVFYHPVRPHDPPDRRHVNVSRHLLPTAQRGRLRDPQLATIRPLVDQDLPRLAALVGSCRGHGGLGDAASARGLLGMLTGSEGRRPLAWLAERDAAAIAAIGLTGVTVASRVCWSIPFLIVAPDARRTGVGTSLVRVALSEAAARGATTVTAETLATWPAADGFWRSVATLLAG
jgi:GNAT superfamily N-acetyltransferase